MEIELQERHERFISAEFSDLETNGFTELCKVKSSCHELKKDFSFTDSAPVDRKVQECIVSSAANHHFYGLNIEQRETSKISGLNKNYVEEKVIREFLQKAAKNIENPDDLDQDPMNEFNRKYRQYILCLVACSLCLCWMIKDVIVFIFIDELSFTEKTDFFKYVLIGCFITNCVS